MKYLFFLTALAVLLTCCKKNNTPNSNNPNTTNPSISNPPASSATPTSALIGKWILKKSVQYDANGLEIDYTNYYNANTCYLNLTNTAASTSGYSIAANGIFVPGTVTPSSHWRLVDSVTLEISGFGYPILFRNNDSMVLISPNQGVLTLSKKPGFCGQNPMEIRLNKKWILKQSINLGFLNNPQTASLAVTNYNNAALDYWDLGNLWTSTGNGWSCTISTGSTMQGGYKVLNDSILKGTGLLQISGRIDTITPNRLVVTGPNNRYILN